MKKIWLGIVALAALVAAPAFAADLPMKAPPPPVPVSLWNGWYIGGNAGYGWNQKTGDLGCLDPTGVASGAGCFPAQGGIVRPEGGLFGAQVGYNWQVGQIVWGLEGDLQWANINKTGITTTACCIPTFTSSTGLVTTQADLEWFGTARARVGYLVTPATLLYITGGLIYGSEKTAGTVIFPGANYLATGSTIRAGGTAGGGVEYHFTENLSGKLEGLWYDMGSTNNAFFNPATTFTLTDHYKFDGAIVRAGLNWRFTPQ